MATNLTQLLARFSEIDNIISGGWVGLSYPQRNSLVDEDNTIRRAIYELEPLISPDVIAILTTRKIAANDRITIRSDYRQEALISERVAYTLQWLEKQDVTVK